MEGLSSCVLILDYKIYLNINGGGIFFLLKW